MRGKRGFIRGAKAGPVLDFLGKRSLYPVRRQALQVTHSQKDICHLKSADRSGGSTLSRPAGEACLSAEHASVCVVQGHETREHRELSLA